MNVNSKALAQHKVDSLGNQEPLGHPQKESFANGATKIHLDTLSSLH